MITYERQKELKELFDSSGEDWQRVVDSLVNAEELHYSFRLYNWDNGFEFPTLVLEREDCDLGTIRMIFDHLQIDHVAPISEEELAKYPLEMKPLYNSLCSKVTSKDTPTTIKYGDELTREQFYKLHKKGLNPSLYAPTPGQSLEVEDCN